jgi:hypothetical protein
MLAYLLKIGCIGPGVHFSGVARIGNNYPYEVNRGVYLLEGWEYWAYTPGLLW